MEFLDKVGKFISSKNYANKGIQTKDGKLAYVTSTGITKEYSSLDIAGVPGPNCPNEFVKVDQTWKDLGFPIGSLMKDGQSCGNEGKFVRTEPPATEFDWKFYLQNYGDLGAVFNTEQQARDHWNSNGSAEGRVPNATILSSMGALGKVGYVDVDTNFHEVQPNYLNQYSVFPKHTNATGTAMTDCSTPYPFFKYGQPIVFMQNGQTGFLNSSSVLQFGSAKTNLFLRPPPGNDRTGATVKFGDTVCISSSSSSYTNDCGWWGCKVARINEHNQLSFGAGGQTPQEFIIKSPLEPNGKEMRMNHTFTLVSIPQSNKANVPLNKSVVCIQGTGGIPGGVYRYSGLNELNYYQNAEIAHSWAGGDWGNITPLDCKTYKFGDYVTMKNTANLTYGDSASCNPGQLLPGGGGGGAVYRYVDENILRHYPSADVARSWKGNEWHKTINRIDCRNYKAGPSMAAQGPDGNGRDDREYPRIGYVSNGLTLFGTTSEVDMAASVFSLQLPSHNSSCNIEALKSACNSNADCVGFVQSTANHTWQMITSKSSSGNYKITSSMQDIYMKDANVDLIDDSCDPGPVSFIKGTVLKNYPQGVPFVKGKGNNKCKIVSAPTGKVPNDVPKSQEIVDKFPNVKYNKEGTVQMKAKTEEYKDVIQRIKLSKPDITLEQQYTDMMLFDEKNKSSLIVWSVMTLAILGFVVFRMKS